MTRREVLAFAGAGGALVAMGGCMKWATPPPLLDPKDRPWQSPHGLDHPLLGQCVEPGRGPNIGPIEIGRRLADTRFVLLGETHDNPDHHVLQAEAIRAIADAGRRPAVLFEMISEEQGPALARYLAAHPKDAAGLGAAIGWEKSGWPDWSIYRPIAETAMAFGLPILPANLDRKTVRALVRPETGDGGHADLRQRLGLDSPLPPFLDSSLRREISEAHCGYVDEGAMDGMVLGQRARDAYMAEQLLKAAADDGAILIAGAGHVRTDRGVPYYLERLSPTSNQLSLAFIEVAEDRQSLGDYAPAKDEEKLPYDLVYFTPRIDARDPCERFKEQLEKMKRPKQSTMIG